MKQVTRVNLQLYCQQSRLPIIMKAVFALLALVIYFNYVHSQSCSDLRIRRNIRSISSTEWSTYLTVFRQMAQQGDLDDLSRIHDSNFRVIHDYPQFLVWHRYFLWDFETRMRRFNPQLTLFYWDAANDYSAPHESFVFSDGYFGGNGDANNDYCVRTGIQSNITINFPSPHCLRRDFQGPSPNTISPWQSPAFITSLIQTSTTYNLFRQNLEHSLHNSMHFGMGGRRGDLSTPWSPTDLIFYPHHANIDRIYARWQNSDPRNKEAMDGDQLTSDGTVQPISRSYRLAHYGTRIGDVLVIDRSPLCYTYDDIISPREDLSILVEERLKASLPTNLLEQYFPKVLASPELPFDHDFADQSSLEDNLNHPLPSPLVLPREQIIVLGLNLQEVEQVQRRSIQFVYDFNQAQLEGRSADAQPKNSDDKLEEDLLDELLEDLD